MKDERGSWYLLTGLILGLGFGLLYAWMIAPVRYVNTEPASLRADFKEQYRALIAAAYLSNGDLQRARARLALLDDPDIAQTIAIQAQLAQDRAGPDSEKNGLGLLAAALNPGSTPLAPVEMLPSSTSTDLPTPTPTPTPVVVLNVEDSPSPTPTSGTPNATRTPAPTVTPLPSRTPTPTPGEPFVLLEQLVVCDPLITRPLIQVEALDAASQPVPGVELIISSDQGEDNFFTGLKPEISLGYADYSMQPGLIYQLRLAGGGESVAGLQAQECEADDGSRYWGSIKLVFIQP
jgi:hypothetical protein